MTQPEHICASCGAAIRWSTTAKSRKAIPLNAVPDPAGSVVIRDRLAHALSKTVVPADGEERFMPHHATCPNGPSWRRLRR